MSKYLSLKLDCGEKLICNICGNWSKDDEIVWLGINEHKGQPIPPEVYEVLCVRCYEKQDGKGE